MVRAPAALSSGSPNASPEAGSVPFRQKATPQRHPAGCPDDGRHRGLLCAVDDFAQALEFTKKVGELAEEDAHHPALLTEWGRTTVTWWTHKIKGLHRNDFIMAAKTDKLLQP